MTSPSYEWIRRTCLVLVGRCTTAFIGARVAGSMSCPSNCYARPLGGMTVHPLGAVVMLNNQQTIRHAEIIHLGFFLLLLLLLFTASGCCQLVPHWVFLGLLLRCQLVPHWVCLVPPRVTRVCCTQPPPQGFHSNHPLAQVSQQGPRSPPTPPVLDRLGGVCPHCRPAGNLRQNPRFCDPLGSCQAPTSRR